MTIPGFTAEISLYRTSKNYRTSRSDGASISKLKVIPQTISYNPVSGCFEGLWPTDAQTLQDFCTKHNAMGDNCQYIAPQSMGDTVVRCCCPT